MEGVVRVIERLPEAFIDGLLRLGSADSRTQARFMEVVGLIVFVFIFILWYFRG
jgi:hypothetical protein